MHPKLLLSILHRPIDLTDQIDLTLEPNLMHSRFFSNSFKLERNLSCAVVYIGNQGNTFGFCVTAVWKLPAINYTVFNIQYI